MGSLCVIFWAVAITAIAFWKELILAVFLQEPVYFFLKAV
jgi:uncharacterized membrane protein